MFIKAVYIHIPFCSNICSYCDFCKLLYQEKWVKDYLKALKQEIKTNYQGEQIRTIYIGGGTPNSLNLEELKLLFDIIKMFKKDNLEEFTIECNIEDLSFSKLDLFKKNNVNRLSLGVQNFHQKHLIFLNRKHNNKDVFKYIEYAKKIGIKNINIDLIYGFANQSINDLKNDLKQVLKLNISHLSFYSLIIEEHTELFINKVKEFDEDTNRDMYDLINKQLNDNGYLHYEISNYAKEGYQSKHNLVYWNNEEYYGFGLGACGFINQKRYCNTKNFNDYIKGIFKCEEQVVNKKDMMINEMILGLRKINGVNKTQFFFKYNCDMKKIFPIDELLEKGDLLEEKDNIKIPYHKLFVANEVLINFLD